MRVRWTSGLVSPKTIEWIDNVVVNGAAAAASISGNWRNWRIKWFVAVSRDEIVARYYANRPVRISRGLLFTYHPHSKRRRVYLVPTHRPFRSLHVSCGVSLSMGHASSSLGLISVI